MFTKSEDSFISCFTFSVWALWGLVWPWPLTFDVLDVWVLVMCYFLRPTLPPGSNTVSASVRELLWDILSLLSLGDAPKPTVEGIILFHSLPRRWFWHLVFDAFACSCAPFSLWKNFPATQCIKTKRRVRELTQKPNIRERHDQVERRAITVIFLSCMPFRELQAGLSQGQINSQSRRRRMGIKGKPKGLQWEKGQSGWLRHPRFDCWRKSTNARLANTIHYWRWIRVDFRTGGDGGFEDALTAFRTPDSVRRIRSH